MGLDTEKVQDLPRNGGSLLAVRCETNPSREGRRRREAQNMTNGQRSLFDAISECLLACRTSGI